MRTIKNLITAILVGIEEFIVQMIKANPGSNVVVSNNEVWINGKRINLNKDERDIQIVVEGDANKVEVDACNSVEIKGSAGSVKTMSGDVHCGDIHGDVKTMSGDVRATKIGGNVSTMSGDVNV